MKRFRVGSGDNVEAVAPLTPGLALLQTLPETHKRVQREADMLVTLETSLIATKGFAAPYFPLRES